MAEVAVGSGVMTADEVAKKYKVHVNTVYNMAKDGRLKSGGTGRERRFSSEECDRAFLGVEPTAV